MTVTVLILTLNEAQHIKRALSSVACFAERCVVVDSGSTDETVALAKAEGAQVFSNPFVNQAQQFNWALDQLKPETDWVFRLDADEIVTPELAKEIVARLDKLPEDVCGVTLNRRIVFMGKSIQWGGVFPVQIVRLFRFGRARSEDRWMDEHILCDGRVVGGFEGEIQDINLNPLSWWISKHNAYASREVVEILNQEYKFLHREADNHLSSGKQAGLKRWLKTRVYAKLPDGARAMTYFIYRYIVRLGFLDGKEGTKFHVLQGFWYRYLVDAKLHEVRIYMERNDVDAVFAIKDVLGIDLVGSRL